MQPVRRRTVVDAAHQPQGKSWTQCCVLDRHLHRAGKLALDWLDRGVPELAHVGGREIAGDAVHAGAIRPVRRQIDFEHGIAEPGPLRVSRANRRVRRQLHDAIMVLRDLQLRRRAQHAPALDTPDGADTERDILAGNVGARCGEHADKSGSRIGRATHHLYRRRAIAGLDHADPQAIRIWMLLGGDHACDGERRKRLGLVLNVLHLKPDHGELVGELFERLVSVEMVLQPGEGEFHGALAASAIAIVSSIPVRFVITS